MCIKIELSIILPLLDIDSYFLECLRSISIQDYKSYELIIISSEEVVFEVNSIIRNFCINNIKYIISNTKETGYRRNLGLKKSLGDYILFMDSDDYYYSSNIFTILVHYMKCYNCDVVCGSCIIYDHNKNKIVYRNDLVNYGTPYVTDFYHFQNESGFYRMLYKKSSFENFDKFSSLKRFQDSLFMVSFLCNKKILLIPCITYVYRKNHKVLIWNIEMYKDHLLGVFKVIDISIKYNYKKLCRKMLKNIIVTSNIRRPKNNKAIVYINIKFIFMLIKRFNYLIKFPGLYFYSFICLLK